MKCYHLLIYFKGTQLLLNYSLYCYYTKPSICCYSVVGKLGTGADRGRTAEGTSMLSQQLFKAAFGESPNHGKRTLFVLSECGVVAWFSMDCKICRILFIIFFVSKVSTQTIHICKNLNCCCSDLLVLCLLSKLLV